MELEALSIVRNCIWSNLDRKRHNLINKRTSRRWRRRGSRLIILWVQAGAAIAMTFAKEMSDSLTNRREWWRERRKKYNLGLIVAGVLAYICYVAVLSVFHSDDRLADVEITVFTILFQGLGYLVMMLVANLLYNLGSLAESVCKPRHPEQFRTTLFNLGFWFSVSLPFIVPALLLFTLFTVPVID